MYPEALEKKSISMNTQARSIFTAFLLLFVHTSDIHISKGPISLEEAVKMGMVEIECKAEEVFESDNLYLSIRNITNKDLKVDLVSGTYFIPHNEDYQDLIVMNSSLITLNGRSSKNITTTAFCTEYFDSCPDETVNYNIGECKKPDLFKIVDFIRSEPEILGSDDAIRSAIWSVSDDKHITSIYDEEIEQASGLRALCSEITGQENVWYNTQMNYGVDPSGHILCEPKVISGEIEIESSESCELHCHLIDPDGEMVFRSSNAMEIPIGIVKSSFTLEVENWPKGDYTVHYLDEVRSDTLFTKVFQL